MRSLEVQPSVETEPSRLDRVLAHYRLRSHAGTAGDLLGAAIVNNLRSPAITSVAETFCEHPNPHLRDLATAIVEGDEARYVRGVYEVEDFKAPDRIRSLKAVLRREPRNVVRWVDLSREYLALGQKEQAKAAMRVPLALRPENRFVLRSATALLTQTGEVERALYLLRRSERTHHDPWLMASLVAVTDLSGAKLTGARHAQRLLADENLPATYLAELAAALGTLEFKAGSDRRARQLMRSSVDEPTENALAQAEWAGERYGDFFFAELPREVPRAFEAATRRHAVRGDWSDATFNARLWQLDQPFSLSAATYGSYVALENEDWEAAKDLAERGLVANPADAGLLNNLAYGYALQDRIPEALEALLEARASIQAKRSKAILTATEGLLLFRTGHLEEGRERYRLVIDTFARGHYAEERARAALNLAREEHLAGTEQAETSWNEAQDLAGGVEAADVKSLVRRVEATRNAPPVHRPPLRLAIRVKARPILEAPPLLEPISSADELT